MPELVDVSRHYDDIKIYDGYTGNFLFKGQFSTFAESSPEGSTSRKRVLSLDPAIVIPPRRAISFLGEHWLVALGMVDGFDGRAIRRTFWMKYVTDEGYLLTPSEACLGAAGKHVKAFREEFKFTVNTGSDSRYDPFWAITLAPVEAAREGSFIRIGTQLFRVRMAARAKEDLDQLLCDQLDGGPTTATFYTGTYDPITDTMGAGSTAAQVLVMDAYQQYTYATAADEKLHSGDKTVIVSKATLTPQAGRKLSMSGSEWLVIAVKSEQDSWSIHARLL